MLQVLRINLFLKTITTEKLRIILQNIGFLRSRFDRSDDQINFFSMLQQFEV